jgi:hypothetical protein
MITCNYSTYFIQIAKHYYIERLEMKLLMTMLFLISSVAMATTSIDLDSKEVSLANFGDITKTADFDAKGEFSLTRNAKTPNKVKLTYTYKYPVMECINERVIYYPCGGYGRGGYGRGGYGRGGYGRGGYGRGGYGRGGYGRGGYGRGGYNRSMCTRVICVGNKYKRVLYKRAKSLKLKFKRANTLVADETELIELNLRSNGTSVSYDVKASDYTNIKKRRRSIKFKGL